MDETALKRAWKDTRKWLLGSFIAWIIVALVFGVVTAIVIPTNDTIKYRAIYGLIGVVIALLLIIGITYIVHLFITPYRQRNEARILLNGRPTPVPLQDRGKLVRSIYEAKTTAIEFIACRRRLSELYEQTPYDIDKDKAAKALEESKIKYNEAIRLLDCEKLVVGDEYAPFISSFIMILNMGVSFWNSTVRGGGDFMITFKSILEANVKETVKHIDRINQQSAGNEGSKI